MLKTRRNSVLRAFNTGEIYSDRKVKEILSNIFNMPIKSTEIENFFTVRRRKIKINEKWSRATEIVASRPE